jgi:CDP-diacylglycerol--glycerol-3-phosphate 3-phosphatidyltransferase
MQKGNFQKMIRGIGGSWMTANMATGLGFLFVVLTGISFYLGLTTYQLRFMLILVPLFLLFRMIMNALDGMLSREYGTATVVGELWNEALDIVGDTICYGSLYFVPGKHTTSIMIFLILCWAAEFFGVLGKGMPNGVRRHETFLGGKPDRAAWMGLLSILLFGFPSFYRYINIYIGWLSILIAMTCIIRIKKTIKAANGKKYKSYTWIRR